MDNVVPPFERAFRLALPDPPQPSKRKAALQLLGGPIKTWNAIHHWRKGRRQAPQWARDRLAEHLRQDAYEKLAVADLLQQKEKAPD